MEAASVPLSRDASWASISTTALLAELSRRQDESADGDKPTCGSGKRGAYDTPLHVFALVLILTLSTLACGFPLFSKRQAQNRQSNRLVFLGQHFGTGVLLATAFVHLLPTAFASLNDPCLPYLFSEGYKPMPGLVAMASALVVVALESYLTTRGGARHSHAHAHHQHTPAWDSDADTETVEDDQQLPPSSSLPTPRRSMAANRPARNRPFDIALDDFGAGAGEGRGLMADASPLPGQTPTSATHTKTRLGKKTDDEDDDVDDDDGEDLDLNLDELDPSTAEDARPLARANSHANGKHAPAPPAGPPAAGSPEEQKRRMLQCMLLEAGILFHSIFIGMAVSVATGPPFVVFLVAIAFHQAFEGLALGSRIAAIRFPRRSARPWAMVLAYGATTPLGQAIGLVVHNLYDPRSAAGLLMVGFMNAVSAGLLLFAGLVQLLSEDFLTEESYRTLRGRERTHAFAAVVAGAALMAFVGAFA